MGEIDRCPGCERLAQEEDNFPDDPKQARGLRRYLVRRHLAKEPEEVT